MKGGINSTEPGPVGAHNGKPERALDLRPGAAAAPGTVLRMLGMLWGAEVSDD